MIPESDNAPTEDIVVSLYATLDNSNVSSVYNTITIPAGSREAPFQMTLPEGIYTFRYFLNSQNNQYADGYYSTTGTTHFYDTKSLVIVNKDVSHINLTLIKGHLVSGKIMLPDEEELLADSIKVIVWYSLVEGNGRGLVLTIQAGTREAQFQRVLPEGKYIFSYSMYNQDTPYVEGYYTTAGTTNSFDSASLVAVNNDVSKIDMTLIKEQLGGHLLIGKIRIPEMDEVPLRDVVVNLWALSDKSNKSSKTTVTIQAGSREAQYQMVLAEGSYTFSYTLDNQDTPYIDGYYSYTGTTNKYYDASLVDVKGDLDSIDLTLIRGYMITGKIMIPETDSTPSQSISVGMYAYSVLGGGRSRFSTITIQAGTREAQYMIGLPEGDYTLSYEVDTLSARYAKGYYSTAGTTDISNSASLVVVNNDMSGIDMTLIKGHLVTGKIMIPEEEATPTENIWVQILASSSNKSGWSSTTIRAGTREAQYQMVLPVGEYTIGYYINTEDTYCERGYYSTAGTTISYNSASKVAVNNDVSGIDMTLIKEQLSRHIVTGTIRIPETDTTPLQDITVNLHANSDVNSSSEYCSVTIPAGSREAKYQMVLPEGEYSIRYYTENKDSHYADGYYSSAGTTHYYHLKTLITVNNDVSGIDMTLIKGHLVTGEIRIPDEEELPAESIEVILWYSLEGGGGAGYIYTIQAGTREVQYRLVLPEGIYTFSCSIYNQGVDYPEGYYSTTGTTSLSSSASSVVVNRDLSGIDMTLIMEQVKRYLVNGTIRIPEADDMPQEDIVISLWISTDNKSFSRDSATIIKAGSRETQYQLVLSEGSYGFMYRIENQDTPYIGLMLYSTSGIAYIPPNASLVDVKGDLTGIDMTLSKKLYITGKIIIPEANSAPSMDMNILIVAASSEYIGGVSSITILAGTKEAPFQMFVPEGHYTFEYSIESNDSSYATKGYFSTSGTVDTIDAASVIMINGDFNDMNICLL